MATSLADEERLKELLKAAIVEVLEERQDLVPDLFEEALEDVALARAIEEGDSSRTVSREEVSQVLESGH